MVVGNAVRASLGAVTRSGALDQPATSSGRGSASSQDDARTLRLSARRTWRFFEILVGPEDHDLPPDNFQEEPTPVVAHRTSPTNLGLYLLSIIAAHDFGWIGTVAAIERLEATIGTMNSLQRFRGHFYNWYDTRDLRPLDPKYISSVDSGNLAGHLVALGQACQDIIDRPLLGPQVLSGISDAVLILRALASAITDDRRSQTVTRKHLEEALDDLTTGLNPVPVTPGEWVARLTELQARAQTMADIARTLTAERGDRADAELVAWAEAVRAGIESFARDLDEMVFPWTRLVFGKDPPNRATISQEELGLTAIAPFFLPFPTLRDTPDRCLTAIRELIALRARLAADPPRSEKCPYANRCADRESLTLCRSLGNLDPAPCNSPKTHEDDIRRDGVRLSLRTDPQTLLDRIPRCR